MNEQDHDYLKGLKEKYPKVNAIKL